MAEYIEREVVKRALTCNKEDLVLTRGKVFINFDIVRSAVEDIPAADVVERKRGEWVSAEGRPMIFYECSLCNDRWNYGAVLHMNYCPNCGADMRTEE